MGPCAGGTVHALDPADRCPGPLHGARPLPQVDDFERLRNDRVYRWQFNRNPFVDHPEWVDDLWADSCGARSRF